MRAFGMAAALALLPAVAAAGGFLTRDLGHGGTGQECIERAREAIDIYSVEFGLPMPDHDGESWAAYGFGLPPGNVSVQIACPYRDNMAVVVLLTAYSEGTDQDRRTVIETISDIWGHLVDPTPPARGK